MQPQGDLVEYGQCACILIAAYVRCEHVHVCVMLVLLKLWILEHKS